LHERLERVLAEAKPQLVFASYGMNDGIALPFDEVRFARFKEGILRLREKVTLAGAAIIHLTPPTFDPLPIRDRVGDAATANATRPYSGYDEVLTRYSAWLMEPRNHDWRAIDIHSAMAEELATRRRENPSFTFAKDGVHPSREGHELMARTLLRALAPEHATAYEQLTTSPVAQGEDWKSMSALVQKRRKLLSDAWLTATGHTRPGMTKGVPLAEAKAQAADIEKEIRALVTKMDPAP
jgi:lysophospholipase L1-like esterase